MPTNRNGIDHASRRSRRASTERALCPPADAGSVLSEPVDDVGFATRISLPQGLDRYRENLLGSGPQSRRWGGCKGAGAHFCGGWVDVSSRLEFECLFGGER